MIKQAKNISQVIQDINEGWDFMQPDMIEYLKEFNSFENN